jgi:hypothetical protein
MENTVFSFIIGVVVGVMLMGVVVWFTMPSLMLIKHKSSRAYTKSLEILNERLQNKQDWHVINITDYK